VESYKHPAIFHATNGVWYSTATGQGEANLEIDWEALQKAIEEFEQEFQAAVDPAKSLVIAKLKEDL